MDEINSLNSEIRFVTSRFSPGVSRENDANIRSAMSHLEFAMSCTAAKEYYESSLSHSAIEYRSFMHKYHGRKLKILDIGVGRGESSVFLASLGHKVYSVEPSVDFCQIIALVKKRFKLDIVPICAVGEEIHKIDEFDFDLVIFNASLHHCDEPNLALKNAHHLLRAGGAIVLCSEIQLRPWVNKKTWYWKLENFPDKMGHYGGNEHAYYSWEYLKMLQYSGFANIKMVPVGQFLNPLYRIRRDLGVEGFRERNIASKAKFLVRCAYYVTSAAIVRVPFLFVTLSKMSLLPGQFTALKSEDKVSNVEHSSRK